MELVLISESQIFWPYFHLLLMAPLVVFTIVRGYYLLTLSLPIYGISLKAQDYYLRMYANIVEQSYHLLTCTSRARLSIKNLYCYLAMKDTVIWAFCSETCTIADAGNVTLGVGLKHKYKSYVWGWWRFKVSWDYDFLKLLRWICVPCQVTMSGNQVRWPHNYNCLRSRM